MKAKCKGCSKKTDEAHLVEELCSDCRAKLGLTAGPLPWLRPAGGCVRCGHRTIIQSLIRERSSSQTEYVTPLGATFGTKAEARAFFSGKGVAPQTNQPIGLFVAYICEKCGYTEIYTCGQQYIPIGPEYGTKKVSY